MLKEGDILRNRYRVIIRLGQGGMGAVYEAHDNVFDTSVALKEVILDLASAADTKAQEMAEAAFEREAKLLAKISHETIPHVKDYFIEENSQFLVMELVDGDDLAKLLKERNSAFPVETLIEWTDQLLDALDYLHTQNPPIIHRDIKPQNLKLTLRQKIKLLDFGIAKGTDSQTANTVTNQTFVAATLNYSPIEQMIRVLDPTFLAVITHKYESQVEELLRQNADVRTDIFALGATVYHLATNKHPAEAIKRGVDIWDGKSDPLEDPCVLNPQLPRDFADFLLKSIEISRDHRYSSAADMRSALHQIMDVSTKPSLTPTVAMNFEDLGGDPTAPLVPPAPSSGPGVEQTVRMDTGSKPSESRTEVLQPNTGGDQSEYISQVTALSGAGDSEGSGVKKKRSRLIWLIPVAGVLLFVLAGAVLGVFVVMNQLGGGPEPDSNVTNTSTSASPEETPDTDVTPDLTSPGEVIKDDYPIQAKPAPASTVDTPSSAKPTPRPTRTATPRPRRTIRSATPTARPRKTPRKTPRNRDCIFNDDCR